MSFSFGYINNNFPSKYLGNNYYSMKYYLEGKLLNLRTLYQITDIKFLNLMKYIKKINNVFYVFGQSLKNEKINYNIIDFFISKNNKFTYEKNSSLIFITTDLGYLNYFELGLTNKYSNTNNNNNFIHIIGNDNCNLNNIFNVYQGSFNNNNFKKANIVFPTTINFENNNCYINLEGKFKYIKKIISTNKQKYADNEIYLL